MAIRNRGLSPGEMMGLSIASITASGVEDIVAAPCLLYTVVVSEVLGAENLVAQFADSVSTAGARETGDLMFCLPSASGAANQERRTLKYDFDPPLFFESGIVVSSTGLQTAAASAHGGIITLGYKT
jgi:hypothetical protein